MTKRNDEEGMTKRNDEEGMTKRNDEEGMTKRNDEKEKRTMSNYKLIVPFFYLFC